MKLNWFSPLPPAQTEIAHHTARLLPALVEKAEVTLWTTQAEIDPELAKLAKTRRYEPDQVPWTELNAADATIYNIGNNARFHASIFSICRHHPGIVALHDLSLQHLFAGYYGYPAREPTEYLDRMFRYHGEAGVRAGELCLAGRLLPDEIAQEFPLTALALERSLGAIVHTRTALRSLLRDGLAPARFAPLPYAPTPLRRPRAAVAPRPGNEPYRLIVFGYLGPNRRLPSILAAIADLPHCDRFHLDVFGPLAGMPGLQETLAARDLRRRVTLHGFVADSHLRDALDRADLAINLRYPTMGEASASQLRIWDHALPSLVTRVGWYAEQPADAVGFVRPDHEADDLRDHLTQFLTNPDRYRRMGQRGREALEAAHSPEAYANQVIELAAQAHVWRSRATAKSLAERAGEAMQPWLGAHAPDALLRRVAEEIQALAMGTNDRNHAA